MLKATVNNEKEYKINTSDLYEELRSWDLQKINENQWHALVDNRSILISILKLDPVLKIISLDINGNFFDIKLEDKYDLLLKELGMENSQSSKVENIKAPMPGKVLDVKIGIGDTVQKGDTVIILEAMKMENIIKSPGEGVVKDVSVKVGDAVDKAEVLITMK